jgi:hypothetical protein
MGWAPWRDGLVALTGTWTDLVRRIIAVCPAGANDTKVLATFRDGIDAGNISKDRSLAGNRRD